MFLANPRMDKQAYKTLFHLNDAEAQLIAGLEPKKQMLIKRPDLAKVVQLNVSDKDYWLYTNSAFDNEHKPIAVRQQTMFGVGVPVIPGFASSPLNSFGLGQSSANPAFLFDASRPFTQTTTMRISTR